jgi:hypothetical protein
MVPLWIEATGTPRIILDALVDTGSDRPLLPKRVASQLGIDVSGTTPISVMSVFGTTSSCVPLELVLELRQPPDLYRWRTIVALLDKPMNYAILGTAGFFEYFRIKYDWPGQIIEIEPVGPLPQ